MPAQLSKPIKYRMPMYMPYCHQASKALRQFPVLAHTNSGTGTVSPNRHNPSSRIDGMPHSKVSS